MTRIEERPWPPKRSLGADPNRPSPSGAGPETHYMGDLWSLARWTAALALWTLNIFAGEFPPGAPQAPDDPMRTALVGAAESLVRRRPDPELQLGLAELQRARALEGLPSAATEFQAALEQAIQLADAEKKELLREYALWRLLPVRVSERSRLARLLQDCDPARRHTGWIGMAGLLQAAEAGDRPLLLAQAGRWVPPDRFPGGEAETAHRLLLQELGQSQAQAGLEVLVCRDFKPLRALRELDRHLERLAGELDSSGAGNEAALLRTLRKQFQEACLLCSRHVLERLFAWGLTGERREQAALRERLAQNPFLTQPPALASLLAGLDEERAWRFLVKPLLESEAEFLEHPPDWQALEPAPPAGVEFRSRKRASSPKGTVLWDEVQLRFGGIRIACDRCETSTSLPDGEGMRYAGEIQGAGQVSIQGIAAFAKRVEAERFVLNTRRGTLTLNGRVRLEGPAGTWRGTACELTTSGRLLSRTTLFDEFRATSSLEKRYAALAAIQRDYSDDALPPDIAWILALRLIRPHLVWHAPYPPPPRSPIPPPSRLAAPIGGPTTPPTTGDTGPETLEAWLWAEAHPGTAEFLEDAPTAVRKAAAEASAPLSGGLDPPPPRLFWTLKNPDLPEVRRARLLFERCAGLLSSPTSSQTPDSAPTAETVSLSLPDPALRSEALHWAAALTLNNTVLHFEIPATLPARQEARLLLDLRAANALDLEVYRLRSVQQLLDLAAGLHTDHTLREHDPHISPPQLPSVPQPESGSLGRPGAGFQDWQKAFQRRQAIRFPEHERCARWSIAVDDLKTLDESQTPLHRPSSPTPELHDAGPSPPRTPASPGRPARAPRGHQESHPALPSSWRCRLVLTVPATALPEPGEYVLVARANGIQALVPLLAGPATPPPPESGIRKKTRDE